VPNVNEGPGSWPSLTHESLVLPCSREFEFDNEACNVNAVIPQLSTMHTYEIHGLTAVVQLSQ